MPVYPSTYRKHLYATGTGLTGPDVAMLSVLAHLASTARDSGWFTVTQKEIADRCGVARRTVIRRLPELESSGWIDIRTTARNGHYQASAYRLRVPESHMDRVTQSHTDHVPQSHPLGATESQRVRSYSRESDSPSPPTAENPTPSPKHWRALPDPHPDTSGLLDELGILRSRRAKR